MPIEQQLNNRDIEILRDAVRDKESEIERLRAQSLSDFDAEMKLLWEIQKRQAVISAYRRLINIHESRKTAAVQIH